MLLNICSIIVIILNYGHTHGTANMLTQKCTHQRVCSLVSLLSIMGSSEMLLSTSTMTSKLQHVKNVYYAGVTKELGACSLP